MSLLPQNRKSAEEIAKLRESLGITGPPPTEDALPVAAPISKSLPAEPLAVAKTDAPALAPLPLADTHKPKPVRSLKRSERISQLPGGDDVVADATPSSTIAVANPLAIAEVPKIVRSLRKSEQGPIAPVVPPLPDSKLPVHRRSEKEIQEIRRQEMLAAQNIAGHLNSLTAHPALIAPGYLLAIAAAFGIYFYDIQKEIAAACVVGALLVAAIIFFKKPLSVHHAAFITVAVLFVVVFGALHYFPQLRHGT
ncbi:MAG: hypothetical protein ACRCXD_15560 [Luteolibacter sp.]